MIHSTFSSFLILLIRIRKQDNIFSENSLIIIIEGTISLDLGDRRDVVVRCRSAGSTNNRVKSLRRVISTNLIKFVDDLSVAEDGTDQGDGLKTDLLLIVGAVVVDVNRAGGIVAPGQDGLEGGHAEVGLAAAHGGELESGLEDAADIAGGVGTNAGIAFDLLLLVLLLIVVMMMGAVLVIERRRRITTGRGSRDVRRRRIAVVVVVVIGR